MNLPVVWSMVNKVTGKIRKILIHWWQNRGWRRLAGLMANN